LDVNLRAYKKVEGQGGKEHAVEKLPLHIRDGCTVDVSQVNGKKG
jgi:hypothetical protein